MNLNKVLLTMILISCTLVFAGMIEHTYYFTAGDIKADKTAEGYDLVSLTNTLNTARAGEPSIPYHSVSLLLPPGEKAESVEILTSDKFTMEGKFNIYPQQHVQPLSKGGSGVFIKDLKLYNNDIIYPENKLGVLITEYLNGHSFALTSFTPVEYNPVSGELAVFTKVTIRIHSVSDSKSAESMRNLRSSDEIVKKINRLDHNEGKYLSLYRSVSSSKGSAYDYLIITDKAYKKNFDTLIDFYLQRGLTVRSVTTEYIYSTFPGIDDAEKIRNYIINEYQNSGIEFVLLGGDVEFVPARGFFCEVQSSELYTDNFIPADLYYSALDGNWNDDNDPLYGEVDEDDLLPELSVARFSFSDSAELTNMLNKTKGYQSSPVLGELRDPLLVGENLYDDPQTWGGDYMDLLIGFKTDNGYITIGIPQSHNITKMYDRDWGGGEWSRSELITEMNQGHSFIHHDGHSNYTYNMRMNSTDVTNSNFSSLNGVIHNYTIIYSSGCMSGGFDTACIGEEFVSIQNLATSYIGNSRYGWFNEGTTEGPSIHMHREFIDALYNDRTAEIGKAHKESKTDTAPWITAPGQWEPGAIRWCFYDCNVLGDPAMSIWTDEPENITVTYPDSIMIGQLDYRLNVKGALNQPLSELNCALIQNGTVIGSIKTNSSGYATIVLDGSYELGAAELRVSGYNTLLHSYNVNIVPNDGKYMVIDSYRINAGADDLIEFGETVSISVTLKNSGKTAASGLFMALTEDDDMIDITAEPINIGSINAGDTLRVENAFTFTVSESVPDLYDFTLNTKLYDVEEEWNGSIQLTANRPILELYGIEISDGNDNILDPGESGSVLFSYINNGHGKANNLSTSLSTTDDRITINTAAQAVTVLNPDEIIQLSFNITADDTGSNGYTSEITGTTNGDHSLNLVENFFISVGSQKEDFESGDFTNYSWYFEGTSPWSIDASQFYAGSYSARSGVITNNQKSSVLLNCNIVNDGTISFYYKTSSEPIYDALAFFIDGIQKGRWSGVSSAWNYISCPVSAGEHIFKWTYQKDGSSSSGDDCARLDNIVFPGMKEPSSIDNEVFNIPSVTVLDQNYPNPFNPETNISYALSEKANVKLSVFNIKGEEIYSLVDDFRDQGRYSVKFNAENLNSGIYFYKLIVNDEVSAVKRMLLIK